MSVDDGLSFDRIAGSYDETRGGTDRARATAADLAPHLPGGDLLEIGVGTGIVSRALLDTRTTDARADVRIAGVDLSPQMLSVARGRLPGLLVRGSALRLPFAGASFDGVVAVHVLHLVADLGTTLREAARVLRPGGRMVAVHGRPQHERDDDLSRLLRPLRLASRSRNDSPEEVRAAAGAAGLRCVDQHPAAPRSADVSPAQVADGVEGRLWSFLWDLDDATWQAEVVPVVDALRSLPDPDRPRHQVSRTTVSVLERPRTS